MIGYDLNVIRTLCNNACALFVSASSIKINEHGRPEIRRNSALYVHVCTYTPARLWLLGYCLFDVNVV